MLITFVADHTVDEFTATAHGMHSGDGPLRLETSGTLPTGLSTGVDYYFLRVSANVGAFATSRANAITGIRETFSSNGTGTHQINIGLPTKAPRISAPGIQVFSADQNASWQVITDGQLASRPQIVGAASGMGASDWVANGVQFGAIRATVASPGNFAIPIPVGLGDILTKVDIRCQHSVATASAIQVLLYSSDTGSTTVQTINSAASTAVQTLTTSTVEIPIDDGRQWGIITGTMSGGAMNRDIMWVRYYVRHRPFMAFP